MSCLKFYTLLVERRIHSDILRTIRVMTWYGSGHPDVRSDHIYTAILLLHPHKVLLLFSIYAALHSSNIRQLEPANLQIVFGMYFSGTVL